MFEPALIRVAEAKSHTTQPILTTSSVVAVKYDRGVLMVCDTSASYGTLQRTANAKRITSLGKKTVIAVDGDFSDYQYLEKYIAEMDTEQKCIDDGNDYTSEEVFSRLTRLMYQRRSKVNPLWANLVVAGVDNQGKSFLASTDKLGTPFTGDYLATGFGLHMVQPVLQEHWRPGLTENEARSLLVECMRISYYRDARAGFKIIFGKAPVAEDVVVESEPKTLGSKWDFEIFKQSSWD